MSDSPYSIDLNVKGQGVPLEYASKYIAEGSGRVLDPLDFPPLHSFQGIEGIDQRGLVVIAATPAYYRRWSTQQASPGT